MFEMYVFSYFKCFLFVNKISFYCCQEVNKLAHLSKHNVYILLVCGVSVPELNQYPRSNHTHGQTDGRTDRQTDRQTDIFLLRQTHVLLWHAMSWWTCFRNQPNSHAIVSTVALSWPLVKLRSFCLFSIDKCQVWVWTKPVLWTRNLTIIVQYWVKHYQEIYSQDMSSNRITVYRSNNTLHTHHKHDEFGTWLSLWKQNLSVKWFSCQFTLGKTTRSCTWLTYISYGIIRYKTCWLPRCDLGNTCWLQGNIVLPNVMTYKIPTPQYNFNKWTDILLVLWDFRDCIVTKNTINPEIRMTSFRETKHLQRLSTDKKRMWVVSGDRWLG